ncbi:hypothetical protein J4E89_008708 [Alternaria sp. Ai002NY15]|nr:hypothetical protein J4E89_008708 [Alternaria sp. Ai002NY15]
MADPMAAVPYSNKAAIYLGPVVSFGVVALFLVIARIYTRIQRTGKLLLEDWIIVVAEPLSLIGICLAIASTAYGWGKPAASFTPETLKQTLRLQFALQTVWLLTLWLVRLSVACSLLRFGTERLWRWPLYFIMGLQTTISWSYFVIQFAQCTPVSSNWDTGISSKCWDLGPIVIYGWVIAGIYIAMDLTLSLMPIRLIRTLNRSQSEKILIGFLMALGLLATAINCAKMTTFTTFGQGDVMQATIVPSLWAKLEEEIGIIASSLPWLKSPAENWLKKMGILKEHQLTKPSFVADMSLPTVKDDTDDTNSNDADSTKVKGNVRVDSVATALGTKGSNNSLPKDPNSNTWQAV